MARKRMVDPDLWSDERIQDLPWGAVPFYIGLISQADDHGRLVWSRKQLHMRIVGVRQDVDPKDVQAWMTAIEAAELIYVYSIEGKTYAAFPNWRKHQYVNRAQPSIIPAPEFPDSVNDTGMLTDDSDTDTTPVTNRCVTNIKRKTNANALVYTGISLRERVRVDASPVPMPEFTPALEALVAEFIADAAAANRDGMISVSRIEKIRNEVARRVAVLGADAMSYGLAEAIRREKTGGIEYAVACAKGYVPEPPGGNGGRDPALKRPQRAFAAPVARPIANIAPEYSDREIERLLGPAKAAS